MKHARTPEAHTEAVKSARARHPGWRLFTYWGGAAWGWMVHATPPKVPDATV